MEVTTNQRNLKGESSRNCWKTLVPGVSVPVHVHTKYRLMCAQRFQEPLNLNLRHPEVTDKRNARMRWRAGGWDKPAWLSAEETTYTSGFDLVFFLFYEQLRCPLPKYRSFTKPHT